MGKRLVYGGSIALGVMGFCAIPWVVGIDDLARTLGQVGWGWLLLFVLNSSGTIFIPAVGWWLLMRAEGIPVTLLTAMQGDLMGFPIDFIVPSAYLGGEPLKTVYVARLCQVPAPQVLATVIVAKFQEFGGLILSMILVTLLFVWHTDYFTRNHSVLLVAVTIILAALLGLMMYAFAGRLQPLGALLRLLERWQYCRRLVAMLRPMAAELEHRIYLALTRRVRVFLIAQAVTCLSAVSIFLRPWLFFLALPDGSISFHHLCALFVLTNLVNVLTVVPGSLGWFEATMAGYTSAAGLGDDRGAAFALLNRVADLTFLTLGIWLILHHGLGRMARGMAHLIPQDTPATIPSAERGE